MQKKKLVVLSGAGVSAESGLKTFRDNDGLWNGHDVTKVATPEAFAANPELVQEFYNMRRRDVALATPNVAHELLASLEKDFDVCIITQNIDDLHERAGSTKVLHLHGEIFKKCTVDDLYTAEECRDDIVHGSKNEKGSFYRPFIVWFGEPVPMIEEAAKLAMEADIFLVIGTSLQVYPASGLLDFLPKHIPKFVVDKVVPRTQTKGFEIIELPATEGMKVLVEKLKTHHKISS